MGRRTEPKKEKAEAKRPLAGKTPKDEGARVRDLEKGLAEAREQQVATAEILRVISSSPTDVQPVFDTIVTSAARLCDGLFSVLFRFDGEMIHHGALHNVDPKTLDEVLPVRPSRAFLPGRAILERAVVHIPDVELDPGFQYQSVSRAIGFRSGLWVPMLREGNPIGVISVARAEPGPFSDSEIALLQTFAEQAVIAIENVRLFKETKEALAQQTATAEILRVISRSPTDLQPVFDTIVRNAVELCAATFGGLQRIIGDRMTLDAQCGVSADELAILQRDVFPLPISRESGTGRAVIERRVVHIRDVREDSGFGMHRLQTMQGFRTLLAVPMLREGAPVGALALWRREVRTFTDSEIGLVQTFADQAVIAIENVRLFTELQQKNEALTLAHARMSEALARQTAMSDILRTISSSPTDLAPTFDAILRSSTHLTSATHCAVIGFDGEMLTLLATNATPEADEAMHRIFPYRPNRSGVAGQVVLDRAIVHIPDVTQDPDYGFQNTAAMAEYRAILGVPMFRGTEVIGALHATRAEPGPFSDAQIELFRTFADQAVIAIENVRLFKELGARNRELTEALAQQTATAEILHVISSSPTDVQPVFDSIVQSANRLCDGQFSALFRYDGELMHFIAHANFNPEALGVAQRAFPRPPTADVAVGRAILERAVVHIPDVAQAPAQIFQRSQGFRSVLAVPMLGDGCAIGAIAVTREEPGAFADAHITLLRTFANQAVIAIENVRLFTELEASNRELTTALDTQTATSDILRVISRSQTDVQPVFEAIIGSAVRLLGAFAGSLTRLAGDQIELAALTSTDDAGDAALRARFPQSPQSEGAHAQVIRNRVPLNIADAHTDPRVSENARVTRLRGFQSLAGVPLLRHNGAVGAIVVLRRDPGGFTDDEIALLQTFADQAVIAIENARLLSELQERTHELTRSVEQLTALGDVGRAVSSSLDLDTVLTTIVGRAVQLSGTDGGTIFEYDEGAEEFSPRATLNVDESQSALLRATRLRRGEGAVGQMAVTRAPLQIPDIAAEGAYDSRLRGALLEAGTRAVLAVPLLHEARIVGGLVVTRRTPGAFTTEIVEILRTFATQSALAIQNARLFHEIERKSRELEVASQHKSEFLANMSHELRTPLNAIIGYSEMLQEEAQDLHQDTFIPDLEKINAAAKHQLSLINDILDLSKIEAGRMELDLSEFDLPSAIDNALILVRERASRRGIRLGSTIDERLGMICGDERKVKQVLLNLLSNALKFTPEGGRIDVSASAHDEVAEVSVTDTGVGIAREDQEAVFEEFRQVGTAAKKVEGTGLGLTLCRKFVELHRGRIWITSQEGAGSTFTFTLPVRREG